MSDASSEPATADEDGRRCQAENGSSTSTASSSQPGMIALLEPRQWRDVFWLFLFTLHLLVIGFVLSLLGLNRFGYPDRLNIDRYTARISENQAGLTETFWPIYGVAVAIATFLAVVWLLLLGYQGNRFMKIAVHSLTAYLAVISVLCFWCKQLFWGIAFAVGASVQFMYVMSVIERIPFTMLILQKAVKMVWNLPDAMRVVYGFMVVMLCWLVVWSFGAAGVVASSIGDGGGWWLLVVSWSFL